MKNLNRISLFPILIIVGLLIISHSCKKDEEIKIPQKPINNIVFNPNLTYGTLIDTDGNVYKTIVIGNQTWMAENLKVIHYRNGDPIHNDTDNVAWHNLHSGAYCDYNNNPDTAIIYGKLYNWYAVNDYRHIAPKGWHVPSDSEWTVLTNYLGGDSIAGLKLYEHSINHWSGPEGYIATNESGFTALPGGCRVSGIFRNINDLGYFWSSTDNIFHQPFYRLFGWSDKIMRKNYSIEIGLSVRCVKDN